jgi:hypothetical protein
MCTPAGSKVCATRAPAQGPVLFSNNSGFSDVTTGLAKSTPISSSVQTDPLSSAHIRAPSAAHGAPAICLMGPVNHLRALSDKTQRSKTLDNSVQLWVIRTVLSNYLDNSATYHVSARYGRYDISVLTSVVGYQN